MTTTTAPTVPGLQPSAPASLSFTGALQIRSFRLVRPAGDLLVYAAPGADASGVRRQYLGHWHEDTEGGEPTTAGVFAHAADAGRVGRHLRGTFDRAFTLDDDFKAVPIPGHTPGSTAFLWDTGEHRVLFTADSLYALSDGTWKAAVLGSSDRSSYLESLERLRDLAFDVLAPWAMPTGAAPWVVVGTEERRAQLTAVLDRVRAGESG